MGSILRDEEKIIKCLKAYILVIAAANIVVGIMSIQQGENLFLLAESIWAFGIIFLIIFHGIPMLGGKNMVVIMVIGAVTSLAFEACGVNFGWFFSQYTYTGVIPGPKILGFDMFSMVGYAIANYVVWATAQSAVGMLDNKFRKYDVVLIPLVSMFLVASIDYATDPLLATILGTHDWHEPGVYYGIPFQNYVGWYIMGYAMYQFIALYLYYQDKKERLPKAPEVAKRKWFWAAPPLVYGSIWLTLPFYAAISGSHEVTVYSGQSFMTGDIYKGVVCVCAGCILAPAVMAVVRVIRDKELI